MVRLDTHPPVAVLKELRVLMECVGADKTRIEQVLRVATVDRGFYTNISEL